MASRSVLPPLPESWSALTWKQLCDAWAAKLRYGGNADVARVAALLALCGLEVCRKDIAAHTTTGEALYILRDREGRLWRATPRALAHLAKAVMRWYDYPYGDPGEEEERDAKGKVIREGRDAVTGYVNPDYDWRDALDVPIETLVVRHRHFALPQVACINYTWQQYRSLQGLASMLFRDGNTDEQALVLQSQFIARSLVPRSLALFDTNAGSIRLRPHWEFQYNPARAGGLAKWWARRLQAGDAVANVLYHICFQAYHTAIRYYEAIYPLLFSEGDASDPLRTAISGESGTLNAVMKYAGYNSQQEVYDSNLPFILDILNTMTKEAKEIEKIKKK